MEATKYYFLDFAHKEAGVFSFFYFAPKIQPGVFLGKEPF